MGSLLVLALQLLFAVIEVFFENGDFLVSLLEVTVYPLVSRLPVLLPPLVVLFIHNHLQLFPSLLCHLVLAFLFVVFLYFLQL